MPDLFLSYSRDDTLTMGIIRDNLRKLGFNLWIDIEHLKPGTPQWERAVKRAVGKTDGMLVLCSPSAEKSEWVNREIHMARLAGKPVAPVLVVGDEWDAIPAGLMGYQYCDMRGRSGPERGFRELVVWLAENFKFDVPEYELHSTGSMQIPAVQIINILGHVEGHVIAIGRDVKGDVSVAGGDIHRQEVAPPRPRAVREEKREQVHLTRPTRPNITRAIIVGVVITGVMGVIGAAIATGGFGLGREGATQPAATDDPITQAMAGVTSNDEWKPYVEENNGVEMALVPAGCFQMGSESGDGDEVPVHEVCFEEPFWIDVYEVTNEAFGSVGCASYSSEPDQPRTCVNWVDSLYHCKARGARLPTEAEWEYAARGPDSLIYPWGNEFDGDNVVYSGNSGNRTWEAGSKPGGISWVGAFDLSGNVWEWVHDWYSDRYYSTLTDGVVNPAGPGSGESRVLRGGSWGDGSGFVRAANRGRDLPDAVLYYDGFRCALNFRPPTTPEDTPTATTSPTPEPTVDPAVIALAMAGVTSNDEWTPYTEEKNGVEMALVPAGCFQMGSDDGDTDERPVHEVCFKEPFWIDVYEVTNEAFGSVGCESYSSEPDQPRDCVNWADSLAHCESRGARLPTEAEWEYAARGPDGLVYPWGNDFDGELLNYCDKNCPYSGADEDVDDGYQYTAPVGTYPGGVSWVGVYDLSGNVWEWMNDWYDSGYYATLVDGVVNPQGPGSGEYHVLRGGSWFVDSHYVRTADRYWVNPSGGNDLGGFRCALSYSP